MRAGAHADELAEVLPRCHTLVHLIGGVRAARSRGALLGEPRLGRARDRGRAGRRARPRFVLRVRARRRPRDDRTRSCGPRAWPRPRWPTRGSTTRSCARTHAYGLGGSVVHGHGARGARRRRRSSAARGPSSSRRCSRDDVGCRGRGDRRPARPARGHLGARRPGRRDGGSSSSSLPATTTTPRPPTPTARRRPQRSRRLLETPVDAVTASFFAMPSRADAPDAAAAFGVRTTPLLRGAARDARGRRRPRSTRRVGFALMGTLVGLDGRRRGRACSGSTARRPTRSTSALGRGAPGRDPGGRRPLRRSARIVVWGGPKIFAAGADVKAMATWGPEEVRPSVDALGDACDLLEAIGTVSIAAVNGYALGGGFELALGCDLRYLATDATLGQPEIKSRRDPGRRRHPAAGAADRAGPHQASSSTRGRLDPGRGSAAARARRARPRHPARCSTTAVEDARRFARGPTVRRLPPRRRRSRRRSDTPGAPGDPGRARGLPGAVRHARPARGDGGVPGEAQAAFRRLTGVQLPSQHPVHIPVTPGRYRAMQGSQTLPIDVALIGNEPVLGAVRKGY